MNAPGDATNRASSINVEIAFGDGTPLARLGGNSVVSGGELAGRKKRYSERVPSA